MVFQDELPSSSLQVSSAQQPQQSKAAKQPTAKQPQHTHTHTHTHTDTPFFLPCHTLQRDWAFYKDAQEKMVQAKQMILEMGAAAKRKEAASSRRRPRRRGGGGGGGEGGGGLLGRVESIICIVCLYVPAGARPATGCPMRGIRWDSDVVMKM